MSKEIRDYLHLYLGCDIYFEKVDYFFVHELIIHNRDTKPLSASLLSHIKIHDKIIVKPILRTLVDMKKHESNIGDEIMNAYDETNAIEAMQGMANMTMYLLKQGFDLFNLIPEGLAIDATKVKI